MSTPEFIAPGQPKNTTSYKYDTQVDAGSGFRIEPPRGAKQNGLPQSSSMIHPSAVGSSLGKNTSSGKSNAEIRTQKSHLPRGIGDPPGSSHKKDDGSHSNDSSMVMNQLMFLLALILHKLIINTIIGC